MKQKIFLSLMVAVCLAACSSDNENEAPQRPLTVTVSEKPMTRAGAPIETATLARFSMNYENSKYDFTKTGSTWNTLNWPASVPNATEIDFYAYNGGTFYYNGGNPYVNFTVDSEVGAQKDFLVAEHKKISYSQCSGTVSQVFDHATAAVRFQVYLSNTLSTALGSSKLQVNSITLKNLKNTGQYFYAASEWSELSGSADYSLSSSVIDVGTTPLLLDCGYLYMLPQSLDGVEFEIAYVNGSTRVATLSFPQNQAWEAGTEYTVDIKLTTKIIQ